MTVLSVGNFKRNLKSSEFSKGDIVFYRGDATQEQIDWGSNNDPRDVLVSGQPYKIRSVHVHSWHTKLTLHQISGRFNSVHFDKHDNKAVQED